MLDRFNERARRALFFSRYEASGSGARAIDSQHILLGVIREADDDVKTFFDAVGIEPARFNETWPGGGGDPELSSAEMRLTPDARKVLAFAKSEAEQLDHDQAAPLHLILGLLRVPTSIATEALIEADLDLSTAAMKARAILERREREQTSGQRTPLFLRDAHYEFIDKISATITEGRNRHVSRQEVIMALMDGLAANPHLFPDAGSLDELRVRIAEAMAGK